MLYIFIELHPKVDFQAWAKVSPWAKVTPYYGTLHVAQGKAKL